MKEETDKFLRKVKDGETTLFYFSGHGSQVDGSNMLYTSDMLRFDLGKYLHRLKDKPGTHIVILDCCRTAGKGPESGIIYICH